MRMSAASPPTAPVLSASAAVGRRVRPRDLRMLAVAAAVWIAALVATQRPGFAVVASVVLWSAAPLALIAALIAPRFARRRTVRAHTHRGGRSHAASILALVAIAAAAAGVAGAHVALAAPERERMLSVPWQGGRALVVEATATGKIERGATGWRFDAVTASVAVGTDRDAIAVPVVVRASERPPDLELGARVEVRGTAFAADAGDRAVLVIDAAQPVEVTSPATGVLEVAAELRRALVAQARSLPGPGATLIPGLAAGDTELVEADLDEDMRTSALAHLTAVSGANCAVVVGLAYGAAAWAGAGRRLRVVTGLTALTGFVVLVTPEPSVVRAAAMAAIAMLAVLLGRAGAGVSVLGTAVAVCLWFDPWLAGTLGFALSVAATTALLLAAGPLTDGLQRVLPHPLALALAVPLAAQLACTPLLVTIDPRLPLYAVLANVLASPAAPVATVVGLAACVTAVVPWLGAGLAALAWVPCAWIAATAQVTAALPASSLPWPPGPAGAALSGALCAATVVWIVPATGRRIRVAAAAVVLGACGVLGGTMAMSGPIAGVTTPQGWSIAVCDVGQGDAVLLRAGERVALVDTGPEPDALRVCLDRFGVSRIDLLVLTHFDLDHRGGADAVVGRTDLLLHGPAAGPDDDELLARFRAAGTDTHAVTAGMTGVLGDANWRVLWPRDGPGAFPAGNDASVVLDVGGGGIPRTLLLGDLSAAPQQALTAALHGPYDVVKVAHHGSADQHAPLYRAAAARIALVTVGENTYGHPRAEILDLVTALGATVVRTDLDGAAAVLGGTWTPEDTAGEGGDGLRVWRERMPPEVSGAQ